MAKKNHVQEAKSEAKGKAEASDEEKVKGQSADPIKVERIITMKRLIDIAIAFMLGLSIFLFMGAYTRTWNETNPLGSQSANLADDYLRYVRVDLGDRLEDMFYGFNKDTTTGVEAEYGCKHIKLYPQDTPTSDADYGFVYAKTVGSQEELHYEDGDGNEVQITSGGNLKASAGCFDANAIDEDDIELSNNEYLMAANAAGDGDVNLIKAGTNDLATLPDSAEMASNAAPTEDEGIANKKYVDDQLSAGIPDDDAFGTWASATKGSSTVAASDGILVAYGHSSSSSPMTIKTDSSNPPTTIRSKDCDDDGNTQGTVMSPVKKGDYYLIENSTTAFWLPIGG